MAEDESVSVRAVARATIIPSKLSPAERTDSLEKLGKYFAEVDAGQKPVSEEEEEAIITEAIRSVRPNNRPIG